MFAEWKAKVEQVKKAAKDKVEEMRDRVKAKEVTGCALFAAASAKIQYFAFIAAVGPLLRMLPMVFLSLLCYRCL